jgi:hypothetical protein
MHTLHANRTFEEIRVGDTAHASRTLTADDLVVFAAAADLVPLEQVRWVA